MRTCCLCGKCFWRMARKSRSRLFDARMFITTFANSACTTHNIHLNIVLVLVLVRVLHPVGLRI